MRTTLISALAAASLLTVGAAWAETAGGAAAGTERAATEISCSEISTMDQAKAAGVVYYIAGYRAGELGGMAGGQGEAGEGAASAVATHGGQPEHGTTATAEGAATGAPSQSEKMTQVAGIPDIPVEQVVTACGEAPDASVSDILDEVAPDA